MPQSTRKRRFSDLQSEDSSIIPDSQPDHESQNLSLRHAGNNSQVHTANMSEPLPDTVPRPSEVRKYRFDMLQLILLPLNCTGWDRAFEFLLDKFDLVNLTKFSVRTLKYIPQDARPDVREVYFTALALIDQVPYDDDP
jgi:hypothetical protein